MDEQTSRELVELVRRRAGDTFRSAFSYTGDDWTALYLRDDVATDELERAIPSLIRQMRSRGPIVREEDYERLGSTQATVEVHENGVLLHFLISEAEGVAVSLDREAAQDLAGFVDRCLAALDDA